MLMKREGMGRWGCTVAKQRVKKTEKRRKALKGTNQTRTHTVTDTGSKGEAIIEISKDGRRTGEEERWRNGWFQ